MHRVALRVAHGGHAIPDRKIRERWHDSRMHLIELMPRLATLQLFDNSAEAVVGTAIAPPRLLLEMVRNRVTFPDADDLEALAATPEWARPIVQAAFDHHAADG